MVAQVLRDLLAGGLDRLADAIRVRERPPAGDGHLSAAAAGNEHWLATVRARAPELLTGGGIHVGTPTAARPVLPEPRHPRPEGGDAPVTAPEPQPATPGGPTFVAPTRTRRRLPDFGAAGQRRRAAGPGYDERPRRRRARRPVLRLRRVAPPAAGPDLAGEAVVRRPPPGAPVGSPRPAASRPVVARSAAPRRVVARPAAPRPAAPEPEAALPSRPPTSPSLVEAREAPAPAPARWEAEVSGLRAAPGEPASWDSPERWPSLPGTPRVPRAPQFATASPRDQPAPAFPLPAPGPGDREDLTGVERTGPWPELPDDSDGWLPPLSVFTEDWVRALDDEQRGS